MVTANVQCTDIETKYHIERSLKSINGKMELNINDLVFINDEVSSLTNVTNFGDAPRKKKLETNARYQTYIDKALEIAQSEKIQFTGNQLASKAINSIRAINKEKLGVSQRELTERIREDQRFEPYLTHHRKSKV